MRALVYDCSAGISGDMNLAALIDLGVDRESLERELSKLHVHGEWKLECRRAQQSGIQGTRIDVLTVEEAIPATAMHTITGPWRISAGLLGQAAFQTP